ncbi:MAG: RNA polymerase sigma factor [Clostridia bacterium]|nr:RNA polymerase sigma factor [Clostridia bacterium]
MLIVYTLTEEELRNRDDKAEELIFRMSCGEVLAMGELYELIETDVYAYALSKIVRKEDAEDITHDTFVQVWKNATQYKPMGKPLAWIFTIEMNLIRRQFNKSQRFTSIDESIEVESDNGEFAEGVINNEFLRQMLSTLSEEEREIITLHIVSGLKHREISKLLAKPLSTVLSKYNRAIKKLQMHIKEGRSSK